MKIYIDGACSGNPGRGAWAVHIVHPDGMVEEHAGVVENTTNNRMELTAAIQAMRLVWRVLETRNRIKAARPAVFTDSQYVILGYRHWRSWQQNGWRGSKGKLANVDLWKEFVSLEPQLFEMQWLRGHNGYPEHERVDQLAADLSRGKEVTLFRRRPDTACVTTAYPCYLAYYDGQVHRYQTWPECQEDTQGRSGVLVKKVKSLFEEYQVLQQWNVQEV